MTNLGKVALLSGVLLGFAPGVLLGEPIGKKGTTPYVTHFIFRPLMSIDIPGLGTATNLEAVGTTQNMNGEKMLDKMSARCAALSVASGEKKYIDGACVLTDSDGDQISRRSIRATSTNRSQKWIAVPISSPAGPASTKGSLGANRLHAYRCPHWLAPAAIPRWISRTTPHGRSSDRACTVPIAKM